MAPFRIQPSSVRSMTTRHKVLPSCTRNGIEATTAPRVYRHRVLVFDTFELSGRLRPGPSANTRCQPGLPYITEISARRFPASSRRLSRSRPAQHHWERCSEPTASFKPISSPPRGRMTGTVVRCSVLTTAAGTAAKQRRNCGRRKRHGQVT